MLIAVREQQVPLISRLAPARESLTAAARPPLPLLPDQDISWEMYKLCSQIEIVALSGYPPGANKL
jgi:hypothetical protein